MSEPVIAVEHLHKRYGDTVAVDDVTFERMIDCALDIVRF